MTDTHSLTKKIPLVECFGPTIQGEGAVIGVQAYFLRFGLCDYKCKMCDSMHAVDPIQVRVNADWLTQAEIREKLNLYYKEGSNRCVTFSGGNPAIHDLSDLVRNLTIDEWTIIVETQGTFCPPWLRSVSLVSVSPKGPGMGESCDLKVLDEFYEGLTDPATGVVGPVATKIVVFDQRDLEFAKMIWERYDHVGGEFYLSLGNMCPPGGQNDPLYHDAHIGGLLDAYRTLWEDIQCDPILSKFRYLPQWHVFVWGNSKGK